MMRVAVYWRTSTIDKQNLDTQILPLTEYANQRKREIFKIYTDQISGSKEKRPWLDKLLADAHQRKFDVVLVFRFDRLSRSTQHLINTLETFRTLWIEFVSFSESIDSSTPAGKMMTTLIAAFAEFEKNIIVERVKAGLDRARKQWVKLGRPRKQVNKHKIAELRESWISMSQIAQKMWISKTLVWKMCQ